MKAKIGVEDLRFTLLVTTTHRQVMHLPAIERHDYGDEGLEVYFSQFYGISVRDVSLKVRVWKSYFDESYEFGTIVEADSYSDLREFGEAGEATIVHLTPKQLKRIIADLSAQMRKAKKRAA